MDKISKALQDLAEAVESVNNKSITRVKVTITIQKPKSNKAGTTRKG